MKIVLTAILLSLSLATVKENQAVNNPSNQGKNMEYHLEKKDKINIIGVPLKTSNQNGQAEKEIPEHWQRIIKENLITTIPHKINNNIVGLYTDYEGDFTQPYTFIIGAMVEKIDDVPEGMIAKTISTSSYAAFPVTEPLPVGIVKTWQQVWNTQLARTYTSDFELYTPSKTNPGLSMQQSILQ